jgi:molybdopterin-guanine dinucleotide biosynthesis protein B
MGFAAFSGTGKTTLLRALVGLLRQRGLRVGVVKHAHHDFDIDHPGKDSYELRAAGATRTVVASRRRWALLVELAEPRDEPSLADLLPTMCTSDVDLVLVEGFKHEPIPKIELHRAVLGHPLLFPQDPSIVAVATDGPIDLPGTLPRLDLDRPVQVLDFVLAYLRLADRPAPAGAHTGDPSPRT